MERRSSLYLTLLSTSHGMNHVYQLMLPAVIPLITAEFKISNLLAGILISCFTLSYSLLQSFMGVLSLKFGRKNLVVLGFVISATSFLLMVFASNIIVLVLLLFLAGIGGSTYHPNGMPLLSEFYKERRGQASGFHQTGGSVGSFVTPLLAGALLLTFDWRLTLVTLSIPGFVLSIVLWLLLVEPNRKEKGIEQQGKGKMKISLKLFRPALLFILGATIFTVGIRAVNTFAPQYFKYGKGINDYFEVNFLFSMLQVAGLFSAPLTGRLSDIFGRKKVLYILIAIESISLYTLTLVPVTALIIPCLFFGFSSFGLLAISDAFLADVSPPEYISTIFGLHFTLSYVTGVIVPPLLGIIADLYGFDFGFMILSIIVPFSVLVLLRVKTGIINDKDK